jgi:hypothetical protein
VFDLARQEVQCNGVFAKPGIVGCLSKLPAAEYVGPEQLAGLLEQALTIGMEFHITELCQFPAAQKIPAERMQRLLLLLGHLVEGWSGYTAAEQLLQLPGTLHVVSQAPHPAVA